MLCSNEDCFKKCNKSKDILYEIWPEKNNCSFHYITFYKTVLGMLYLLEARAVIFQPTNKVTGTKTHGVVMNKSLVGQIRLAV